jgi:VanZ family protein
LARQRKRNTFVAYWLPVLVYVAVIFTLSGQPHLQPPFEFRFSDKLAHLVEYAILGALLARAVRTTARLDWPLTAALLALLLGMVVGVADEMFQSFIPGRDSSGLDFAADTLGLVLAQMVYLAVVRD